jgi:hypothetical protein
MRLFDFAFLPNYPEPLERLAGLARTEPWGKGLRYLKSYFNQVFDRAFGTECMSLSKDGTHQCFHTGLYSSQFRPIYAVFTKNERPDAQPWFFRGFAIEGSRGLGEAMAELWDELPQPPAFVESPKELILTAELVHADADWEHLVLDFVHRWPKDWLDKTFGGRIILQDIRGWEREEASAYFSELREAIRAEQALLRTLISNAQEMFVVSLRRHASDYRTAIPLWMGKENRVGFGLPLASRDVESPDVVLALELGEDGRARATSVLTPEMAYNNARVFGRPESTWLVSATAPHGEKKATPRNDRRFP